MTAAPAGPLPALQCVYERALAEFPLTHSLWLQYGQYMESAKLPPAVANAVYARATRNCSWVGAVWERALRALDRSGAAEAEVAAMYGRALAAGMQVRGLGSHARVARHACCRRCCAAGGRRTHTGLAGWLTLPLISQAATPRPWRHHLGNCA